MVKEYTVIDHNHLTREIMPKGLCPACDQIRDSWAEKAWLKHG